MAKIKLDQYGIVSSNIVNYNDQKNVYSNGKYRAKLPKGIPYEKFLDIRYAYMPYNFNYYKVADYEIKQTKHIIKAEKDIISNADQIKKNSKKLSLMMKK